MMIVVVIIGVTAALAIPTVNTALADARAQRAALDLIRVFRQARADAMSYGRAMMVDFNQLGSTGGVRSRIRLFRGRVSTCNSNDWPAIAAIDCGNPGSSCVARVDMQDFRGGGWDTGMVSTAGAIARWCFQANGAMAVQPGATGRYNYNAVVQGGWQFTFRRYNSSGSPEGVIRRVLLAQGGEASLQR